MILYNDDNSNFTLTIMNIQFNYGFIKLFKTQFYFTNKLV